MKQVLLSSLLFVLIACNNTADSNADSVARAAQDSTTITSVQWIDSLKDIGPVPFGETVKIDFEFKNTGTQPLYIVSVEPGCGCTVADFPKKAIASGEKGTITAAFDTNKGSEGEFRKNILVKTNGTGAAGTVLYFTGTIVKDGAAATKKAPAA